MPGGRVQTGSAGSYNGRMGSAELVLVLMVAVTVLFGRGKVGSLIRALEEFQDQFWRGPRPPTHPLPGNDSKILNRLRSRR
jgi:hypothetical protein